MNDQLSNVIDIAMPVTATALLSFVAATYWSRKQHYASTLARIAELETKLAELEKRETK